MSPPENFQTRFYGGPRALDAIGRTGDADLLEAMKVFTASPRKGNVAEAFEALRFWRAVMAAVEEAKSTDGTQESTGQNFGSQYNFSWYGFESPEHVRKALLANVSSAVAQNISTLVDYYEAFELLMKNAIWEDLKWWAFATEEGELHIPRAKDYDTTVFFLHSAIDDPRRPNGYASRPGPGNMKQAWGPFTVDNETGLETMPCLPNDLLGNVAPGATTKYKKVAREGLWTTEYDKYAVERIAQTVWISEGWIGPPGKESLLLESGVIDVDLAAHFAVYGWWAYGSGGTSIPRRVGIYRDAGKRERRDAIQQLQ